MTTDRTTTLRAAAIRGAGAGLVGVVAMTAGENLEQLMTRRPNSYLGGSGTAGRAVPPRREEESPTG